MKKLYLLGITILVSMAMLITSCNRDDVNNDDNGNTENPSGGSGDDPGSGDNPGSGDSEYPSTAVVIHNAVTDYDGNSYDAVQIGNQVWMAKNLRTTHYADGTSIPGGSTGMVVSRLAPNNDESVVPQYGYLYSWSAAMHGASNSNSNPSDVQGVCPNGWHLPSDAEWQQLEDYMKSQPIYSGGTAKALAATTGWTVSYAPNTPGYESSTNNASGFSALPAGTNSMGGVCMLFGDQSIMWSTTELPESSSTHAFGYSIAYMLENAGRSTNNKSLTMSVRCVRN